DSRVALVGRRRRDRRAPPARRVSHMPGTRSRTDREAAPRGDRRIMAGVLVLAAMALVVWIRTRPLFLAGTEPTQRSHLPFTAADGRSYVHLGDFDSYYWLRAARRYLESGSACDRVVNGECRDEHTRPPFGSVGLYTRSLHVMSIVWLHRLMTW